MPPRKSGIFASFVVKIEIFDVLKRFLRPEAGEAGRRPYYTDGPIRVRLCVSIYMSVPLHHGSSIPSRELKFGM